MRRFLGFPALLLLAALAGFGQQVTTPLSYPGFGTSNPATCIMGQLYFRTDSSTLEGCTATNTWTALGGSSAPSLDVTFRGICQNTVASFNASWEDDALLAKTCHAGSNVRDWASIDFLDTSSTVPLITNSFLLPATLPSSITMTAGVTASTGTSQAMKTRLQTACVPSAGGSPDPPLNTAQTLNFNTSGSAGQETVQTLSAITLTGCLAGYRLIWVFNRDVTDTSTANLQVNWIRFVGN